MAVKRARTAKHRKVPILVVNRAVRERILRVHLFVARAMLLNSYSQIKWVPVPPIVLNVRRIARQCASNARQVPLMRMASARAAPLVFTTMDSVIVKNVQRPVYLTLSKRGVKPVQTVPTNPVLPRVPIVLWDM